ncbi:unnamed protein product [Rangifer tarandus platyrhynchus]|uniref:Uncharacterized protein n=2 Tax=Rangifer tarandus platyrhynchus TaxID=3082113 RepID=A0ACB0FLL2_RANTA|nr:unnamed protein product [Rangifer tarandus platyrhynchus]CAI9713632.1 unnamed protein product [Rangifer tarandus platyrhynchus]
MMEWFGKRRLTETAAGPSLQALFGCAVSVCPRQTASEAAVCSNAARLQKRKMEAPAEPLASGPRKSMEGRGNAGLDATPDISGRAGFSVLSSLECDMSLPGRLGAALPQPRPPQPGPATLAAPPGLLAAHGCPAVARRQAGSPAS